MAVEWRVPCRVRVRFNAVAADLTADTVTKAGKKTSTGKISVKGEKYRMETAYTPIFYIGRGDKGIFWEINGAEKDLRGGQVDPRHQTEDRREAPWRDQQKTVGTETIDGHPAKKYEVSVKEGNKTETYNQWWATDINFPVKLANSNGSWSIEYKNIKKGAADSLFELPPGVSQDNLTSRTCCINKKIDG